MANNTRVAPSNKGPKSFCVAHMKSQATIKQIVSERDEIVFSFA